MTFSGGDAGTTNEVVGSAPRRSPTVRVLAAYSNHTDCNLASVAFVSGVDMDKLLVGTHHQVQFGQSPFAFARGIQFERSIRANSYAKALDLLRTQMHFKVDDARVVNLHTGYQRNSTGMAQRADATRGLIEGIVRGRSDAPNLIDGAVLTTLIAGRRAFFEADAIAARFEGPIHAGEVKSFPIVDGRPEPDKLAAALDQVAVYIYLTQQLVADLGGDPGTAVSMTAMLIAPRNVGLTPTLEVQNVQARVRRVTSLLQHRPPVSDLIEALPNGVFGDIADRSADPLRRLNVLDLVSERVGTKWATSCLSTCGAARYCRSKQIQAGSPSIGGEQLARLLPGISSLPRAIDLASGAAPNASEAPTAVQLARAKRMYDERSARRPHSPATRR